MAGFLYFLPDVQSEQAVPDLLSSRGLGTVFRDLLPKWRLNDNVCVWRLGATGPGGKSGLIVYPQTKTGELPRTPGYKAEQQEWVDCGDYWLGYDTELNPKPMDLERPVVVDGYETELGDGNVWVVPIIRREMQRMNLPRKFTYTQGEWFDQVLPEYAEIWNKSARWWDACIGRIEIDSLELLEACCEILSVNYRVSRDEASALGILDNTNFYTVFTNACDRPWWMEQMQDPKKKEQLESCLRDLESLVRGQEEQTQNTAPAEQT